MNLYKQIAAFLILVAFIAQSFSKSLIYVNYYTNTEAYAKNCINKDKPEMHCNGKCQMIKKIKAEEKKDQQAPERKIQNELTLSARSYFATITFPEYNDSEIQFPIVKCNKEIKMPHSIFHPPTA